MDLPAGAIDLGSGHHVLWMEGDLIWKHPSCRSYCFVDITSGEFHSLISREPLHIEASVLCPMGCGTHGFIRGGRWIPA